VLIHAQDNASETDFDIVYKIAIGRRDATPKLMRSYRVGLGDLNATSGVGNDVRMDFQTVTIFSDGRLAVSFLDSTTENSGPAPALAIELNTKVGRRIAEEPAPTAGTAQAPISTTVTVLAPGAGERIVGVTSAVFEFDVPAAADDAGMVAQLTPLLPADVDLYLQQQVAPGTWSGDLASGTSGSLTDEVLESGRLVAGSRYRIEVHNWAGAPGTADLQLTFFNSAGEPGQ
jgi:hypothetical protein